MSYALDYLRGCPECRGLVFVEYDLDMVCAAGALGMELAVESGAGMRLLPPTAHGPPRHAWRGDVAARPRQAAGGGGLAYATCAPEAGRREPNGQHEGPLVGDRHCRRAAAFGFRRVGCVSSGNMGSSIANYAARAGLQAFVFTAAYASEATDRSHGGWELPICTSTTDRTTRWRPLSSPIFDECLAFDAGSSPNPVQQRRPEDPGLRNRGATRRAFARTSLCIRWARGTCSWPRREGFEQLRLRSGFTDAAPLPVVGAKPRVGQALSDALEAVATRTNPWKPERFDRRRCAGW